MSKTKLILKLFLTFFKIGAFTFGGGYAMIPLIEKETVEKNEWITSEEILEVFAISESTPGPIAINTATFIGYKIAGFFGAAAATLGVVLPSFIIILIVAKFIEKFRTSTFVSGALTGLKPCVVALIGVAVLTIGKTVFFHSGVISMAELLTWQNLVSVLLFGGATVMAFKKVHPIIIICISAAVGIATGYIIN